MKDLTIRNLRLTEDGEGNRWLTFISSDRKYGSISVNHLATFMGMEGSIANSAVQQWSKDQVELKPTEPIFTPKLP